MACTATSYQAVNLEVVINPIGGTAVSQTVTCGYLADTTPYVDSSGLLHVFSNLNTNYDVTLSDVFALACAPSTPFITVPITPTTTI